MIAVPIVIIKELGNDGNFFTINTLVANDNIAITHGTIRIVPIAFNDCINNINVLLEESTIWRPNKDGSWPTITITAAAEVKPFHHKFILLWKI